MSRDEKKALNLCLFIRFAHYEGTVNQYFIELKIKMAISGTVQTHPMSFYSVKQIKYKIIRSKRRR